MTCSSSFFYYYFFLCNHRNKVIKAILMPRTLLCLWSLVLASEPIPGLCSMENELFIKTGRAGRFVCNFSYFSRKRKLLHTHTYFFATLEEWFYVPALCDYFPFGGSLKFSSTFLLLYVLILRTLFLLLSTIAVGNESNTY